jgi:hypothetical protein
MAGEVGVGEQERAKRGATGDFIVNRARRSAGHTSGTGNTGDTGTPYAFRQAAAVKMG